MFLMNNKYYFSKLDIIKCFAYFLIFFQHTGFKYLKFGPWGVSFFLVMSGFLLMNSFYNNEDLDKYSFLESLKFAIYKIKPVYILHLVCLLFYIPLMFAGTVSYSSKGAMLRIFTNLFLIQEWFPMNNSSLNECSWFLSSLIFCYFLFPFLLRIIKKYSTKLNKGKSLLIIVLLFVLQIVLCFVSYFLPELPNYDITYWFIYRFPLTRFIDFAIGCFLYILFIKYDTNKNINSTSKEVLGILLTILSFVLVILYIYFSEANLSFSFFKPFTYSVIFTPSVCLLVFYFALGKGMISKITYNEHYKKIANLCRYNFLIHYVVFDLVRIVLTITANYSSLSLLNHLPIIKSSVGLVISFVLSYFWGALIDERLSVSKK